MKRMLNPLAVLAILGGAVGMLAGCQDDKHDPAASTAQEALGVKAGNERERTVESRQDVSVVKDTKVIDNKTGEVLSEKKEVTPVTIQKDKEVKTDVKVKVGDTQSTVK